MKHTWIVESADIEKVKAFLADHQNALLVRRRVERNLGAERPAVDKTGFWQQMVACLLTMQQRSGPTSAVTRFIRTTPFPLAYSTCLEQSDVAAFVKRTLTKFGGLRRTNRLATEIARNLSALEANLWQRTLDALNTLRTEQGVRAEREAADFIADTFHGFGPKQARNLLQSLGLTRHEIPIDSRITKWLNEFGFPVRLSASALADRDYYAFVMDGVQALCQACELMPCVLDAAIFASFDGDGWTEENIVW